MWYFPHSLLSCVISLTASYHVLFPSRPPIMCYFPHSFSTMCYFSHSFLSSAICITASYNVLSVSQPLTCVISLTASYQPCPDSPEILYATREQTGVDPGDLIIYTCHMGYHFTEGGTRRSISCLPQGKWSAKVTQCKRTWCFYSLNPQNADIFVYELWIPMVCFSLKSS